MRKQFEKGAHIKLSLITQTHTPDKLYDEREIRYGIVVKIIRIESKIQFSHLYLAFSAHDKSVLVRKRKNTGREEAKKKRKELI